MGRNGTPIAALVAGAVASIVIGVSRLANSVISALVARFVAITDINVVGHLADSITLVAISITGVGVDVAAYGAGNAALIAIGIAGVVVDVGRDGTPIATLITGGVASIIIDVGYRADIATGVTGGVAGIIVHVRHLANSVMSAPVTGFVAIAVIHMSTHLPPIAALITGRIASIIVNMGY